jgi:hypothetical protein
VRAFPHKHWICCINSRIRWARKLDFTPWDAGNVQPSFKEAIELVKPYLKKEGTALVPGCGRVSNFYETPKKKLNTHFHNDARAMTQCTSRKH